jgi:hypothetical protein
MTRQTIDEITSEEAYHMQNAEFRGMVIQSLKDIREDITDLKSQNNISRWVSMGIAGVAGIVSGVVTKKGL